MVHHKKPLFISTFLIIVFFVSFGSFGFSATPPAKNVIILVADGMGASHTTLTRWYKGSALTLDSMLVGGVRTYSADSMITDSAPAATAFATGYKSDTKFISVLPQTIDLPIPNQITPADALRPVATILEAAKLAGKSTGLVATANIQHATPASFSAHWPNRNDYNELGEQQVYQGMDIVLGGGKQYLLPDSSGGKRKDGADLVAVLKKTGYDFVETPLQMQNSKSAKIWGAFAQDAMAFDFDRDPAKEPSLAEMTRKAISVLTKNPKGFLLFVEASKIDWASHANDPIGVIGDVLAYDAAVKVALDFAKTDKNTLVLAFSDHGNGGMSIGSAQSDKFYDTLKLDQVIAPLKQAKLTGEGVEKQLNADRSNIIEVISKYYGVTDLTPAEIEQIKKTQPGWLIYTIGPIISQRSCIGWTTTGHTGEDLFLYAYGPGKPAGFFDNTEIPKVIEKAAGLSLQTANRKLFVKLSEINGLDWNVNNSDPKNPVITIKKNTVQAELPASTNLMRLSGKEYNLPGIALVINGIPYVPQQALELVNSLSK